MWLKQLKRTMAPWAPAWGWCMQDTASKGDRNLIKGATGDWEVVIGLEVHAQVASKAKLFSGASTAFGGAPNSHVSLVDAAMPGMLPVINEACVAQAVRTGPRPQGADQPDVRVRPQELLLSGPAAGLPDLPVQAARSSARARSRSTADGETAQGRHRAPAPGAGRRQVDPRPASRLLLRRSQPLRRGADGDRLQARHALGQAGAGLRDASCAPSCAISAPATATWRRATCAPTSTCRCAGRAAKLGTRCEIKNVNSIRFIGQAIEAEARRQIDIIEDGGSDRAGDAPVRSGQGRDALHALQGGGARLPLFPRSRPAAAGADAGVCRRPEEGPARAARRQEARASCATTGSRPTTPACWWPSGRAPTSSRRCKAETGRGEAARWKTRRQLGHQRAVRAPQQGRPGHRAQPGLGGAARRHHRPDRLRRHLRQDRQGRVRDRLDARAATRPRSSRSAG